MLRLARSSNGRAAYELGDEWWWTCCNGEIRAPHCSVGVDWQNLVSHLWPDLMTILRAAERTFQLSAPSAISLPIATTTIPELNNHSTALRIYWHVTPLLDADLLNMAPQKRSRGSYECMQIARACCYRSLNLTQFESGNDNGGRMLVRYCSQYTYLFLCMAGNHYDGFVNRRLILSFSSALFVLCLLLTACFKQQKKYRSCDKANSSWSYCNE